MPVNRERQREYGRKYREANREKVNAIAKKCRRAKPEKYRAIKQKWRDNPANKLKTRELALLKKYNMTLANYDALLNGQNGVCALCSQPPNGRPLAVDHCHETGRIRGLLCTRCNNAIGLLGDDVAAMLRVIAYLERSLDECDRVHSTANTRSNDEERRLHAHCCGAGGLGEDHGVYFRDAETGVRTDPRHRRLALYPFCDRSTDIVAIKKHRP
jgi:hypothetical protein